jgi:hypothetical protein
MSIKEAFYHFSLLLNKNSERKNINIEPENFVLLYNRESKRWLAEFIEKNNSSDNIHTIAELRVDNFKLTKNLTNSNFVSYNYPDDYFSILSGNSYSVVKKGNCVDKIYNYFKKPNDFNIQTEDKFTRPSFEWERGLGETYQNGITIFKTDFEILDTYISYYRQPLEIDSEGYIKIDGSNSKNINPDLSDYLVGQIIDRIVVEVNREFENQVAYQLSETRKQITI